MSAESATRAAHGPLFLLGLGRGGSTWVLDALAGANNLPTVFEPFQPERVKGAGKYGFYYVPDNDPAPGLKAFMDEVLAGERGRLWTKYRINPGHLWHGFGIFTSKGRLKNQYLKHKDLVRKYFKYRRPLPGRPLVKFIRANLMAGWLKKTYDAPVLVLLRHPGAVAESKNRLESWDSAPVLRSFLADPVLRRDYLDKVDLPDIEGLSRVAGFAMQWCVEVLVVLDQAARNGLTVVSYEGLVAKPEIEWARAVQGLGLEKTPDPEMLRRPSQQVSLLHSKDAFDTSFLSRWKKRLGPREQKEIVEMLERFNLDVYSMDEIMPRDLVHATANQGAGS